MNKERDFSKIYSFSKLERFEKCPLDYCLYYLDPRWKGYKKPKSYKTIGSAVHSAITLFYHLSALKKNFQALKNSLYRSWISETEPNQSPPLGKSGGFGSLEEERQAYRKALSLLKNFYQMFLKEKTGNFSLFYLPTKNIEDSFEDYEGLIQPINKELSISGKFDRVDQLKDGTLRIVDFKTKKGNSKRFQLDFYKILAEMNFMLPVTVVSFYYLDGQEIADFSVSDCRSEEIKNRILAKLERIDGEKDFPPKPSRLCHHCDFEEVCPVFKRSY